MEASRFSPYRDLLLLAKTPRRWSAGRATSACARRSATRRAARSARARPAPPVGPLGDLGPAGEGEDCDVAIVGSGAGGAVAAAVLAEAGPRRAGARVRPHVDRDSYPTDPLEALPLLYRDGGLTIATGKPAIPVPVGRAVGGTTVINSGTCFRAPEEVLRRVARRGRDRLGDASWTPTTRPPRRCWR